jgi:DNA-binding transcriptional LysR family regulator
VRDSAGVARGELRVTAPVAFARQQLVPHLSAFLRANPEVRVQLEVSDRISSLASEGFDLAIRHSAAAPETHVAWTLCAHALGDRGDASVSAPARHTRLAQDWPRMTACSIRAQEAPAWTFERATGRKSAAERVTVPINGPFSANNSETLRDAALDDLGIALLPDFSAQAALRAGH